MSRTTFPADFGLAVQMIDDVLAVNEAEKRGVWREQSPEYHAAHLANHAEAALYGLRRTPTILGIDFEIAHAAVRAVMLLQRWLETKGDRS